jgi:dephospho-CoA kinase
MLSTKIIGLTGGIGSGKTTVSQLLCKAKIPIYFADIEAKWLMQHDTTLTNQLKETFGEHIYENNKLKTKDLASIVFNNPSELKKLNALVHPVVRSHFRKFVNRSRKPYVIIENAILYESGMSEMCDYVIVVTAPIEERIKRVMQRDEASKKEVEARMKNQWDDERKIQKADFVIHNLDRRQLQEQVEKLLLLLKKKYK